MSKKSVSPSFTVISPLIILGTNIQTNFKCFIIFFPTKLFHFPFHSLRLGAMPTISCSNTLFLPCHNTFFTFVRLQIIPSIPPTTFYYMYVHVCMYVWSYMFTFLLDLDMIYVRIQFPIPIQMNNNNDISTLVFATKRQWIGTITVRRHRHSVIIVSRRRRRRRLVMINGLIKCINQNRTTATDLEYGLGTCAPSVTAMSLAEFLISISKCSTSCHMSTHTLTYKAAVLNTTLSWGGATY